MGQQVISCRGAVGSFIDVSPKKVFVKGFISGGRMRRVGSWCLVVSYFISMIHHSWKAFTN